MIQITPCREKGQVYRAESCHRKVYKPLVGASRGWRMHCGVTLCRGCIEMLPSQLMSPQVHTLPPVAILPKAGGAFWCEVSCLPCHVAAGGYGPPHYSHTPLPAGGLSQTGETAVLWLQGKPHPAPAIRGGVPHGLCQSRPGILTSSRTNHEILCLPPLRLFRLSCPCEARGRGSSRC